MLQWTQSLWIDIDNWYFYANEDWELRWDQISKTVLNYKVFLKTLWNKSITIFRSSWSYSSYTPKMLLQSFKAKILMYWTQGVVFRFLLGQTSSPTHFKFCHRPELIQETVHSKGIFFSYLQFIHLNCNVQDAEFWRYCGSQHSLGYNGTIIWHVKKKEKENSITNALLVK